MQLTKSSETHEPRRVGEYIGTVNTQGRVTIPEEVRRVLNLHPQDKLVFRVTEDTIELPGKLPTLEELAGSVQPLQPNQALDEIIHDVKVAHYSQRVTPKIQS